VTGATVRVGSAGAGECGAAAWLRCGIRSGLLGPACWGVTVGFPAADGAIAGCRGPAAREYSPKPSATTSASASATVQPCRRRGEGAAGTTGSRAAGEPAWCRSAERSAATSPGTAGGASRRRRGAWADVASNSSRLTLDNSSGDRQTASYSSTSGPGSAPTALAMPRMCPRA
jgi:hypothetical protein